MLRLYPARTAEELEHARILFLEYAGSIGLLEEQSFDDEVTALPGAYGPPRGRLLLAEWEGGLAGCVALRPFGPSGRTAELNRLFVRERLRGHGIARALVSWAIDDARAIGYETLLVDTLARLPAAVALYLALGFSETTAYRASPMSDTIYFTLALSTRDK